MAFQVTAFQVNVFQTSTRGGVIPSNVLGRHVRGRRIELLPEPEPVDQTPLVLLLTGDDEHG